MKSENKVSHLGSLYTITEFKRKGGNTIKLTVGLESISTFAGYHTFFKHHLAVKGYKCRNYESIYHSRSPLDDRYLEYITKQELYEAYYNHWIKLNPFRLFAGGRYNSDLTAFQVEEIPLPTTYKSY